ncbi:MAG TPA: aminodeoxychorismate synthase component I [Solirubrobacteraceae bacterium]|jgi:para-aminobenzoate synthetase|nr:aminodeoxychorismate synthase component I [Solirubrobacteraceae bacterium]
MSTLLVDNYDSYTYNVYHLLAAASGEEPIVVHNDMVSWRALSRWDFDAIVLSPGPGHPARWHDFGVCSDVLRFSQAPVLGVCLGHQGLGHVLKATVATAPAIMHGRLSQVKHTGEGLFAGIPQGFSVVRYHSLAVTGSLGEEGREIAWTPEGVVMGIEHTSRPLWGVQFHPESICTEHGHRLFENFYALARERRPASKGVLKRPSVPPRRCAKRSASDSSARLHLREYAGEAECERLFESLFGEQEHAFWLDSAERPTKLGQCSYLGASLGEHRLVLEYDVEAGTVSAHDAAGTHASQETIFAALERELAARALPAAQGSPRGLAGGFVGYLGYECKADCGATAVHSSDVPDAVQLFANRMIAVDHATRRSWAIAVSLDAADAADAERWLDLVESEILASLDAAPRELDAPGGQSGSGEAGYPSMQTAPVQEEQVVFRVGRGREQYVADILRCQSALAAGESYEVCLTDQIHTDARPDPWHLYRGLRRSNPAPFAAYLKLGEVQVLSSSPERFLSVDRERKVMARPIKGTAPRSSDPATDKATREELAQDEKTFAEHLMIVDLLRNDLGRVCEVDTVRVPELMQIEQYATVHQMISNVEGVLEAGRSAIDCVRACFPGGSMTGAPKLRTMEIIDDVEREARGVYSGAIGWFGLEGTVDLSIVIRTIVMRSGEGATTTIGAGGAIVMQSDPAEEFAEILLKARAPMAAIARAVSESRPPQSHPPHPGPPRADPDAFSVELEPRALESVR